MVTSFIAGVAVGTLGLTAVLALLLRTSIGKTILGPGRWIVDVDESGTITDARPGGAS